MYCSLTGYGPQGTYCDRPGHDLNYIALSGLLDLTGTRDGPPVIPRGQIADVRGVLCAVVGIQQALLERHRTSDLTGGCVCYQVYATKDRKYMTLGALEPKFWENFYQAVGREHLTGEQFAPAVNGNRVYDDLCALFRSYTREQWAAMLFGVETCCELVYSLEEALNSQPMRALGMLTDDHILPAVRLSERSVPTPATAPALGEHINELLAELGCTADQISALKERGIV